MKEKLARFAESIGELERVATRGRPTSAVEKCAASVWLPTAIYDRLIARARSARKSVSAIIREIIERDVQL